MTGDLAELRVDVAARHGLDERAAGFLSGETVAAMEASARSLAELFAHRRDPAPEESLSDVIARSLSEKEQRKRALEQALHGPRRPERDAHGRFTGFDGGARGSQPRPRDPERDHGELVGELASFAKLGRSGF